MALFGLLMAPLAALSRAVPLLRAIGVRGIGAAPALIALALYALLPIVRNTVIGLASVPISAFEAGRGMGMSPKQLFWRVEWPMALPHVLTGLRTASVQAVGNTAVAALIGAGGLGMLIFQGLGQAAPDLVLLGVIPLILLAVAVDRIWGVVMHRTVSQGLQMEGAHS
jgi:osmoprotectant transport system permease protein